MFGISALTAWISTLISWILPSKPEKKVEYIVTNSNFIYTTGTTSAGSNTYTIGGSGGGEPVTLVEAEQCDITDEEYEEAVSIFDSLTEEGITEENKELFQEMKVIIEKYENGLPQQKENHFSVID